MTTPDPTPENDPKNHEEAPEGSGGTGSADPASPDVGAPERLCRRCSTVTRTAGAFCPQCGARYERRGVRSLSRRTRWIAAAVALVLVLGGGGTAVALKVHSDQQAQDRERAADRAREEAAEAARRAAADREAAAQEADASRRRLRRSIVRSLERSITQDARKRATEGVLEDRASSTSCENTDGHEEDPDRSSGEYDCIAVTDTTAGGRSSGYRFTGRADYEDGTYTWQLGD